LQVVNGAGRGAVNTMLIGLSLRAAPPAEQATAMGAYQAIYAIGMFAGPAVSGPVADHVGLDAVFWCSAGACVMGALLVLARRLPDR
jgi:predicted MFS family arabinose efflux permease